MTGLQTARIPNLPSLGQPPAWAAAPAAGPSEVQPAVWRADYTLSDLAGRGLIPPESFAAFCADTLLADFSWRLLWAGSEGNPGAAVEALRRAEGIIVFVHGWDGSGEIWEDLPALVLAHNPHLAILVPDVNGFGGTPFSVPLPPIDRCNPPALMAAVERWLHLLGLRDAPSPAGRRPFVFVGHSMGGAALFFHDEQSWPPGTAGWIAAAPALLLNDHQRQGFYRALGTAIRLSALNPALNRLAERHIAPRVIGMLAGGASDQVQAEHAHIFKSTPEGVIARTFTAMGRLDAALRRRSWPGFLVFLAEHDRLVGQQPALELLEQINFGRDQIRLVPGDHYFFSLGPQAGEHARNRDLLLRDILAMQAALRDHLSGV